MATWPLFSYASSAVSVVAGATRYFPLSGSSISATSTEDGRKLYPPASGTLRNLWVRVITSTISAGSGTVRTRKSNANGNMAVSITGTGTFEDTTNTDSYTSTNSIYTQMVGATTGDFAWSTLSAVLESATDTALVGGMNSGRGIGVSTTLYAMLTGGHGFHATEAHAQLTSRMSGTISNLRGFQSISTLTAAVTLTLRKNGANGNESCSWPGGTSGTVEDATHSDTFVAGDLLCVSWANADATTAANTNGHQCSVSGANGSSWVGMASDSPVTQAEPLTQYYAFSSRIDPQGTESNAQVKAGAAVVARNLQVRVSANAITGTTTATLRQNAADTALVVSIGSSATGTFEDTTHSVTLAASDQIDMAVVTPSVTGTPTITLAAMALQLDQPSTGPTRFYLPSSGTPGMNPALRVAWSHTPGTIIRRPMATTPAGTAFAATSYAPDGADHLVAGTAHIAQFVSAPLAAQTIGAQTVSLAMLATEDHANNNLFLYWTVYAVTAADSLVGTLVAARADGTEVATSATNRTDSTTSTSVTVGDGDRLVFEIGLSGTPTATGGVQGHNGAIRFGDSGSDLAANDTATTDGNPWIEFAFSGIVFQPQTSDSSSVRAGVRGATSGAKGGQGTGALRAAVRGVADGGPPRAGAADFTNVSGETLDPTLPSDWKPDDIHILLFSHNANGAMASLTGWTQLYAQNNGTGQRTEVWWRRAQAGDTAPSVTLATNTVTTLRGAVIYGVRGAPTSGSPFDTTSILTNAAAASVAFTDVSSTQINDYVLALGAYADSPTTITTMSGWTQRSDAVDTFEPDPLADAADVLADDTRILAGGSSAAGMSLLYEWRGLGTPGAAGASSVTVSGGTFANAVSTGVVLALKTIVPAGGGLFRGVDGSQPNATGALARQYNALRSLTGSQPNATGALTRQYNALRSLAGSQPNATGTLTRAQARARSLAGSQPNATGTLARIVNALRSLTGNQPNATGTLARRYNALRSLAGSQPNATGALTRSKAWIRSLAGSQPNATGAITSVPVRLRSMAGNQPYATGTLASLLVRVRSLAGNQPTAMGTLARVATLARSLAGNQPNATATLARLAAHLRALAGNQPNATGALARSQARVRSLAGSQPNATATLARVVTRLRALAGDQPNATGTLARLAAKLRALAGSQPNATGILTRIAQKLRSLAGIQPSASATLAHVRLSTTTDPVVASVIEIGSTQASILQLHGVVTTITPQAAIVSAVTVLNDVDAVVSEVDPVLAEIT